MIFENQEIDISTLPSVEATTFQKLAKSYVTVRYIGNTIFFFVLSLGIATLYMETEIKEYPTLLYGIIAFWIFWLISTFLLVKLGYDIRGYVLREKDIVYRKGVLVKSLTTIPFNRVQHCEISQGPIQRYFDLHTLEIFTAGGSKSDLAIPGLQGDTAQQLKEFILKRTKLDGIPLTTTEEIALATINHAPIAASVEAENLIEQETTSTYDVDPQG